MKNRFGFVDNSNKLKWYVVSIGVRNQYNSWLHRLTYTCRPDRPPTLTTIYLLILLKAKISKNWQKKTGECTALHQRIRTFPREYVLIFVKIKIRYAFSLENCTLYTLSRNISCLGFKEIIKITLIQLLFQKKLPGQEKFSFEEQHAVPSIRKII